MSNNMPIDEYSFWKNTIEDMQDTGESVPGMMFDLLEHAEKKTLQFLMAKYNVDNLSADINLSRH